VNGNGNQIFSLVAIWIRRPKINQRLKFFINKKDMKIRKIIKDYKRKSIKSNLSN
jgi:hypothetical protein